MNRDRAEIEFAHGARAGMVELHQTQTYEGLREGLPTREMNARMVKGLRGKYPGLHLLPVVETAIEWPEEEPYPFGTPASLPSIQCVARFWSREDPISYREGTFAWFQGEWALPIEDAALEAFRHVDWTAHSRRHEL